MKLCITVLLCITLLGCVALVQEQPEGKHAVCHKGKTVYVDEHAVKAHLNHGDHSGACR